MLIRDPVHGDIALAPLEVAVLDLPAVQRLRGIRQLGTASLVYPGAVHTRFDHSLGVCALAHRIVEAVRRAGHAVDDGLATLIGAAALLHDVTHVPYGHTLEDERRLFPRHDKGVRLARLLDGALGEALARLGIRERIAAFVGLPADAPPPPAWAREIVASTIDADLLDYLRRDAYFTGLAQQYDDRIFRHFVVADGHLAVNLTKHGMERPDARSEIVQLLRLRYFLTERVYYHHTKVSAGAMISKAVELAQEHGRLGEDELLGLNDWTLLDRLRCVPSAGAPDPRIVTLVDRLEQRALLKRGYVCSALTVPEDARRALVAAYHESGTARRAAEVALARELGCDAAEVILYCPALTMMKEAAARVVTPRGVVALNRHDDPAASEIRALEARHAALWRLYVLVPESVAGRAGPAAAALIGHPNEHQPRSGGTVIL